VWRAAGGGACRRGVYDRAARTPAPAGDAILLSCATGACNIRRISGCSNELVWHYDRGNQLCFSADSRRKPTNHSAEWALSPAVIARRVSQCSQNRRGVQAFAALAFTSVVRTLAQHDVDFLVAGLYHMFRFPSPQGDPS
jgi:hypothetical protein